MRHRSSLMLVSGIFIATVTAFSAQALEVLPLSDATNGAPPKLVDIGSKSAGLTFTSSVPLACTVVYGKSQSFGKIANDPDMGALTTIDHNPVLGGLEPNTKYFFRVQGTAADGKLYAGITREFTTAEKPKGPAGLMALSASVQMVSSNYGGGANDGSWGANSALDGDPSTAWSSSGDGTKAFLVLEFGKKANIGAIDIWTRSMSDGTAIISTFTATSDDGTMFGPFTLPDASKSYRFDIKTTTSTLRIDAATSTGGNTGLVEVLAYEVAK